MSMQDAASMTAREATDETFAIDISGITKVFNVYRQPLDRLKQALFRGRRNYFTPFTALQNVSFQVRRGETVGIVGRNGSGKSTLLQIVAGLLNATEGSVTVNGRVSALLELGAGFNPAATGRENIYMNGAILGLSQKEIDDRFDDIVAFSGLAEFLDRPVETYSSGMFVRLAFAVAVSVDPEIFIVDEALAVGDEGFQRKCFARIEELKRRGATILFVSHAAGMITQLCDRAVLLDRGEMLMDGSPKAVIASYHKLTHAPPNQFEAVREEIRSDETVQTDANEAHDVQMVPESRTSYVSLGAEIQDPRVETLDGKPVNLLVRGRKYIFRYRVAFTEDREKVLFAMMVKTMQGVLLAGRTTHSIRRHVPDYSAGDVIDVVYEFECNLTPGTYFLNAGVNGLYENERKSLHRIMDAAMFKVLPDDDDTITGMVAMDVVTRVERVGAAG
ncbi:ABC transporter ATP-binding protein [Nisaea acidiphila]|uniref:ABC transporter ATP-binding protein n=1 Tax=Nisaea acidiphila TaxID=1862145 RepID=A0A9J7ARV1_9PROT|nr:ABC transporter ATP-binding protein [Nisaea acidiphila]UUX49983.1 ABC transporter ATP-binding protein [Nisaea acidiphila]